jgi:hypothetical protein
MPKPNKYVVDCDADFKIVGEAYLKRHPEFGTKGLTLYLSVKVGPHSHLGLMEVSDVDEAKIKEWLNRHGV